MSHFLNCLIALTVLVTLASMIDAIGMPPQSCCCQQSCGCGGGYGRKKREAVQPHYKTDETPCPQTAWKEVLEQAMLPEDAVASVSAIQTGLFRQYADQKFLVTCSSTDEAKTGPAMGNKVHFSSSGDGYCNLVKEKVWCQAVALSA